MVSIAQYFQSKIKNLNSQKIQWKLVVGYFGALALYVGILYLVIGFREGDPTILFGSEQGGVVMYPPQSPTRNMLYSIIWPVLSGLSLVLIGWFMAVKFLNVSEETLSVPALINFYFFSKLIAWLVGLPVIFIGWFAAVPAFFSPSTGSFTVDVYSSVIMPFYPWVSVLVYGTLLVTSIVFAVQEKNDNVIR